MFRSPRSLFNRYGLYNDIDTISIMETEQLINRALAGDQHAITTLYNAYSQKMVEVCNRVVGDRLIAEELAHDAFLLAIAKLNQLSDPNRFGQWLSSITHHIATRYMRRDRTPLTTSIADLSDKEIHQTSSLHYEDKSHELPLCLSTPLQQLNTTFNNITKENFRYSYRNHDKFTIKDDAGNTQFQIIEEIGFICDGSTINNGHLLNYPYIEQTDSREYQITFSRLIDTKNGSTIYEIPAGVDKITIDNNSIITYRNGMISTNEKAIIEIFNINGRKVASAHGMSLSIPNLYNGMYIVRITTPYQSSTAKILIK